MNHTVTYNAELMLHNCHRSTDPPVDFDRDSVVFIQFGEPDTVDAVCNLRSSPPDLRGIFAVIFPNTNRTIN